MYYSTEVVVVHESQEIFTFKLHCVQRPWFYLVKEEKRITCKRRKITKEKTLWAHCDLAYREKGKEKSIIAAGPLRVAAVIAGIWTQSLRYTASQSGASSMQTVYYHHSFT